MAVGVKRIALFIVALAVLFVGAVIAATFAINTQAMRAAVEDDIRSATGLDLNIRGPVEASIFPAGTITFHDVRLKSDEAEEPALHVERLQADLRVLPLLFRHFRIASLTLNEAKITVIRQESGATNWDAIVKQLARALRPASGRPADVSEIRFAQSRLTYRDPARSIHESLNDIDISLGWPSISKSFGASGQVSWKGRRVELGLTLGDFLAFLTGEKSGVKLRLGGSGFKAAFDGTMSQAPDLVAEGTLSADTASLRDTLRWIGRELPGNSGFGRFALKAKTRLARTALSLSDVNLEIDGNVAEGVLSYSGERRKTLQGTLAGELIDLTAYLASVRGARKPDGWNRAPFDLQALGGMDVDMRFSAAQVSLGTTRLGRTALAANLNAGNLTLSIAEAQIFGGMLKGSAGIARQETSARVTAQLQFTDVDLQACTGELFDMRSLTGKGALALSMEATGANMLGLARTLSGNALLAGQDGAFVGLDIEALLQRLERRPLSGVNRFRGGQTPYKSLNVAVKFDQGVATAENVVMEAPNLRIRVVGTASIPAREFDLKGTASLVNAAALAKGQPGFELPFIIQGPWDDPLMLPVPDALIRRSPASAPLLDAIREKKTRDAVRSAIERLTGTAPAPASPPATEPESAAPAATAPAQAQ